LEAIARLHSLFLPSERLARAEDFGRLRLRLPVARLTIHPGRALVRKATAVGKCQDIATPHLVIQRVEAIVGRAIRFGMQRLPQLLNLGWRY
jgi:hypothetical protein